MRIAVMGAGALGSVIGGLLARTGEDVTLVTRGPHLEAVRERGLTVKSPTAGTFTVQVAATGEPADVGPVELVVFGVKLYDLEQAAERMRPLIGPDTVVLPMQNGIDAAERIGRIVGPEPVLGGTAVVGGRIEEPGVVAHTVLANTITCGEWPSGTSPRTERVRAMLERAGFKAEAHPDVRIPIWEKFITLAATAGVMALTRLSAGPIRDCPETRALFVGVMEEAAAIALAQGIEIALDLVERQMVLVDRVPPATRSSMATDLLGGRRLELESLNGTIVRLGRELGVPTPLNFAIYAALKPYVDGPPSTVEMS